MSVSGRRRRNTQERALDSKATFESRGQGYRSPQVHRGASNHRLARGRSLAGERTAYPRNGSAGTASRSTAPGKDGCFHANDLPRGESVAKGRGINVPASNTPAPTRHLASRGTYNIRAPVRRVKSSIPIPTNREQAPHRTFTQRAYIHNWQARCAGNKFSALYEVEALRRLRPFPARGTGWRHPARRRAPRRGHNGRHAEQIG